MICAKVVKPLEYEAFKLEDWVETSLSCSRAALFRSDDFDELPRI